MTIKLLCGRGKFPAGAIVTLDAGTEAGLIAANQASADLTGGMKYVEPRMVEALSLVYGTDGKPVSLASRPRMTIVGDSQLKNNFLMGYSVALADAIPGITDIESRERESPGCRQSSAVNRQPKAVLL
jgi:hypothetical protein